MSNEAPASSSTSSAAQSNINHSGSNSEISTSNFISNINNEPRILNFSEDEKNEAEVSAAIGASFLSSNSNTSSIIITNSNSKGPMLSTDLTISDDEDFDQEDLKMSDEFEYYYDETEAGSSAAYKSYEEEIKKMATSSPLLNNSGANNALANIDMEVRTKEAEYSPPNNNNSNRNNNMTTISPPPSPPTQSPSYNNPNRTSPNQPYNSQQQQQQQQTHPFYQNRGKPPSSPHSSRHNYSKSLNVVLPPTTSGSAPPKNPNHPPRHPDQKTTHSPPLPHHNHNVSMESYLAPEAVAIAPRKRTISTHSYEGMEGFLKAAEEQEKEMKERVKRNAEEVSSLPPAELEKLSASSTSNPIGFAMERFLSSMGLSNKSTTTTVQPPPPPPAEAIAELHYNESLIEKGEVLVNMPDPRVPQMYNDIMMPCGSDATSSLLSDLIANEEDLDHEILEMETGDKLIQEIEETVAKEKLKRDGTSNMLNLKKGQDDTSISDGSIFDDVKQEEEADLDFFSCSDKEDKVTPFSDADKLYMSDNFSADEAKSSRDERILTGMSGLSSPGGEEFLPCSSSMITPVISNTTLIAVNANGDLEVVNNPGVKPTAAAVPLSMPNNATIRPKIPPIPKPPLLSDPSHRASTLPSQLPTYNAKIPLKLPPSAPPPSVPKTHRKMRSDVPSKIAMEQVFADTARNRTLSTGNISTNRARTTSQGGDDLRSRNWKNTFQKTNVLEDSPPPPPPPLPAAEKDAPSTASISISSSSNNSASSQKHQNRMIRPGKVPASAKKPKAQSSTPAKTKEMMQTLVVDGFDYDKYHEPEPLPVIPHTFSASSTLFMDSITPASIHDSNKPTGNPDTSSFVVPPPTTTQLNTLNPPPPPPPTQPFLQSFAPDAPPLPPFPFPPNFQKDFKDPSLPPPPPPMFPEPYLYSRYYPDQMNQQPMLPPPPFPPPPSLQPPQSQQQPQQPQSLFSNYQSNSYYPALLPTYQQQQQMPHSFQQHDEETAVLLSNTFLYPYGGTTTQPTNFLNNKIPPNIYDSSTASTTPRPTILSSVLISISRTLSDTPQEDSLSKTYSKMSFVERAFPDRLLGLLVAFAVEIPVWIMITGNNSESLCILLGRKRFSLIMAFLPICCALSGATALQSSTMTKRSIHYQLITTKSAYSYWVMTEFLASSLLGIGIGILITFFAYQASGQDASFAASIGFAQCISIMLSGIIGSISPIVLGCIFSGSRTGDVGKWHGWFETVMQDLIGTFCMIVFGERFLVWFGPIVVEVGDSCIS